MSLIRIGRGEVAHILYIRQNVHTVNDQWMKYSAVNSQSPAQSMVKLLKTSHLLQLWLAYGNDCQEGNVSVALVGQNSHHRIPTPLCETTATTPVQRTAPSPQHIIYTVAKTSAGLALIEELIHHKSRLPK